MINKMPKSWVHVAIADICDLINGRAFKPSDWTSKGLPIIRIQNLNNDDAEFNYCDFEVDQKFIVGKGQLLFAWSGTPGTSFGAHIWNKGKAVLNQHIFKVQNNKEIIEKVFLMYLLNHKVSEYVAKAHGTAGLAHITKGKFENSEIPLPPLNEQKRIVAKIEELFTKLDAGIDSLKKVKVQIKRYRQAVLKAAFEGKLTENLRRDDEYDEDLIPLSWSRYFLPDVMAKKLNNGYSGKPVKYETPIRVLSLSATTSGIFNGSCYKYLDESFSPESPFWLKKDDILLQRGNTLEYVGVPAIYKGNDNQYLFPDLMIRLTINKSMVEPNFLCFLLSWEKIRNYMRDNAVGTAGSMPKINQEVLKKLPVYLPPLPEQHQIVSEIERRFSVADEAEKLIDQSLKQAERLRQSILKRAFEGKLVPQDPNDEPASVLLERIRAEKARLEAEGKAGKMKKVK